MKKSEICGQNWKKPLKILYFKDQLFIYGGAERVTATKLNGWVQNFNHNIYLVTTEQNLKPFSFYLDERIKKYDLSVNYIKGKSLFNFINIKKTINYIFRLRRLIRKINPDIIVSVRSASINLFLPFISGRALTINEYHSSGVNLLHNKNSKKSVLGKVIGKFNKIAENKYTSCVVLNKDELNYFSGDNFTVIPNPILIPKYKEKKRENIVVAAGRVSKVKGYDLLISSWKKVNDAHPDWNLHIYGDGEVEFQKKLKELAEKLKLKDSIKFYGATSDLFEIFFKSSIHVLSSSQETFGMVILEAQACGLPTVSFNCPTGPKNLIQNGLDGILVPPKDINTFAEKIIYLIENPKVRIIMGQKGRENVIKYSLFSVLNTWNSFFYKLMSLD